jgi:uncharacterized protein
MKITTKLIAACAILYWVNGPLHAQTTDAKRALAVRAVAVQEGPEMDRMLAQLTGSATQQMIGNWNARVTVMPISQQTVAIAALDAELKTFNQEAFKLITAQAAKVRGDALLKAYMERFTEDELKQLVVLMEAPVFKKYQTATPDLGRLYVTAIVDGTRGDIAALGKVFDTAAAKIVSISAPVAAEKKP